MKKICNKTKRRWGSSKQHGKTRKKGGSLVSVRETAASAAASAVSAARKVSSVVGTGLSFPFTRTTTDIVDIKESFITACNTERARRQLIPGLKQLQDNWGSLPLPVIIPPKHSLNVSQQNAGLDKGYQVMGAADTIVKATAVTAAVGSAIAVTFVLGTVCPPLLLVSITLAAASFLVCQVQKNIELVNTSELIMIICQNMVEDLTRMLVFYMRIGVERMEDIEEKNPFIGLVLKKLTQLQISIIKTSDRTVVEFMAVSYGILKDDFKSQYDTEKIFGKLGMENGCHTEKGNQFCEMVPSDEDYTKFKEKKADESKNEAAKKEAERAKPKKPSMISSLFSRSTLQLNETAEEKRPLLVGTKNSLSTGNSELGEEDPTQKPAETETPIATDSDNPSSVETGNDVPGNDVEPARKKNGIEGTGKTFSSIKRAIITRLGTAGGLRAISNASSPYELYRELIRDITIIGLLFSQASARFSLDGLDHHQSWIDTQSQLQPALKELQAEAEHIRVDAQELQKVIQEEKSNQPS
jgi:hypothetical protein